MVWKDAWYDFKFLKFNKACFVVHHEMYPGERSTSTWKEWILLPFRQKPLEIEFTFPNASFEACVSSLLFSLKWSAHLIGVSNWGTPVLLLLSSLWLSFCHSVMPDSLWPRRLQHARLPCRPSPGACSSSCPLSQWCHPTILSLSSPSPPAWNLPQHQSLFQWVSPSH